jgi:hypothetical protein
MTENEFKPRADNDELTPEAKDAIRRYAISLFALPTVILSTGFGLVGYFIGNLWASKAYLEAMKESNGHIQAAYTNAYNKNQEATISYISEVTKNKAELELVLNKFRAYDLEFQRSKEKYLNLLEQATSANAEMQAHLLVARGGTNVTAIADNLRNNSNFNEILKKDLSVELKALEEKIQRISIKSRPSSDSSPYGCGSEQKENPSNSVVMYGLRDGTSCGVPNKNYYKELYIEIPK